VNIYFFQWISELGGADTRLKDLIKLLCKDHNLYSIPNDNSRLSENDNLNFFKKYNVKYLSWSDLPKKLDGVGIAFCNFRLFSEDWRIKRIKDSGLKFIWSNDMMWHTDYEIQSLRDGMIDAYLYTSEFHKEKMQTKDSRLLTKEFIIPNYFDADSYDYFDRPNRNFFTIGKHSRPDDEKFSDDFPLFYENLNLKNPRYRVMGVSDNFKRRFVSHNFNDQWDLLAPNQEKTSNFLNSLDLYVYNSCNTFIENQSRAIIEASLNGLPIIAPNKYNFPKQIIDKETGFLHNSYDECKTHCKELEENYSLRKEMGFKGSKITKEIWCDKESHIKDWQSIFSSL
jgi:glycosyltransferase involved in cell wall biosynthesis